LTGRVSVLAWGPGYVGSVLAYCWRCWRHRAGAWGATALAVGAVLSLAGAAELFLVLAERSLDHQARSASEFQVFLADGAQAGQVSQLEAKIGALPGVEGVSYRSKEEALRLASQDPTLHQMAQETAGNPFPASLVVELKSPAAAGRVAAVAMADPATDHQVPTSYTPGQGNRLEAFLSMARALVAGVAVAALGVAGLVATVLLRSEIRSRRAELAILTLVGTPRPVIRLPVLVEAVSLALAGSVLAAATLSAVGTRVVPLIDSYLPFLQLGSAVGVVGLISLATLGSSVLVLGVCSVLVRLPR